MTSSAVEVRGLAPGLSYQEVHDLFATVGPLSHVVTSCGRDGKSMSAVVVYENPAAAGQALQYLQGYSPQASGRLRLQPASQAAASLAALSQQFTGVRHCRMAWGTRGFGASVLTADDGPEVSLCLATLPT